VTGRTAPSREAGSAAPRTRAVRPSRRKRFALTIGAAAAGFVIVFQFLALQLQAGKDPAIGGAPQASRSASAPAHAGSAPVVTRSSGGVQSVPVSTAGVTPAASTPATHGKAHHQIRTATSGGASANAGQEDDLD
jgi:hypothetical protein